MARHARRRGKNRSGRARARRVREGLVGRIHPAVRRGAEVVGTHPGLIMDRVLGGILCLGAIAFSGCAPLLSELIVSAPNRFNPLVGNPDLTPPPLETIAADQHFYVSVGPPDALLSVSVL